MSCNSISGFQELHILLPNGCCASDPKPKDFKCSCTIFGNLKTSSGAQRTLIGHSGLTQLETFIIYFFPRSSEMTNPESKMQHPQFSPSVLMISCITVDFDEDDAGMAVKQGEGVVALVERELPHFRQGTNPCRVSKGFFIPQQEHRKNGILSPVCS